MPSQNLFHVLKVRFWMVVDLRKNSKTFGEYFSLIISENNKHLFIPKGFAHGFKVIVIML